MKIIESFWNADDHLLVTRLQGVVDASDVQQWKESLQHALALIPDNAQFKIIIDLYGYEFSSIIAHKSMRSVVPLTLAQYGLRTSMLDLFDPVDLPLHHVRGITCVAAAHVNHDEAKMHDYEKRIGRPNERYFTNAHQAETWIRGVLSVEHNL